MQDLEFLHQPEEWTRSPLWFRFTRNGALGDLRLHWGLLQSPAQASGTGLCQPSAVWTTEKWSRL